MSLAAQFIKALGRIVLTSNEGMKGAIASQ